MAAKETGVTIAVIGAVAAIGAACISSGAYKDLCPGSVCKPSAEAGPTQTGVDPPAISNPPGNNGGTGRGPGSTGDRGTATRTPGRTATDVCVSPYVWREAVANDHVCVPVATRDQVRRENALAPSRKSSTGGAYGPDTCVQGYVWRGAVANDHVCVTPERRDETTRENDLAESRRVH